MTPIPGNWYPEHSSARYPATLEIDLQTGSFLLKHTASTEPIQGQFRTLQISDRIGNIPRKISLADGSVFETVENDVLDQAMATTGMGIGQRILHTLESRWKWVLVAALLTLLFSFSLFKWGLPWSANKLAYSMPASVTQQIGGGILELMDKSFFAASTLPDQQQLELRQHFHTLLDKTGVNQPFEYRIHFRNLNRVATAFALPSGDIVLSDELIRLADNQHEIDAVLLHEAGHVVHRHGLQILVQSTFVTALLASITGDVSGSGELLVAFPTFLLQSHYDRQHEADADEYAFSQMLAANIDPKHFAGIMQKMSQTKANVSDEAGQTVDENRAQGSASVEWQSLANYLVSHPLTEARIERAMSYSRQYQEQTEAE